MSFDAESFLSGLQTDGALPTNYSPVPEGEYVATVDRLEVSPPKLEGQSPILGVFWKIDDPTNDQADGRSPRQSIFLDVTAGGKLDSGPNKNVKLGRVAKALGQDTSSPEWNPLLLQGGAARIVVTNRPGEPGTAYEGRIFDDVKDVVAL